MGFRYIVRILIAWTGIASLTGCIEKRSDEEMKDSIVYGYEDTIYTFDPAKQRMMKENAVMAQVLEGLTRWNNDIVLEPALATHWEQTDNCRTWTFFLRPNVKFHDGTAFDSTAVKLHFERLLDPATASTKRHLITHIESISTPEPLRVVFRLKDPDCTTPENFSGIFAAIPSPTAVEKNAPPIAVHPVGTGPFRFVEWVPDVRIVMERNPDYWNPDVVKLRRLEFRPVPEATTRLIQLEQGVLDMADIAFTHVKMAADSPYIELQTVPQLAIRYIGFNVQKPPFNDVRVRRAANYAVNREELIKHQFFGVGQAAQGPLPPVLPGFNPEIERYEYNPEKAKQLLAEAGYPNGLKAVFWTMEKGAYSLAAEAAVEDLRQVGIEVELIKFENASYWKKFDAYLTEDGRRFPTADGVFDLYVGGWVGGESEIEYLRPLFRSDSTSNNSFYNNPVVDELLKKFNSIEDPAERQRVVKELQKVITDDAPWIFAYYSQVNVGMNKRVKGFRVNPSSRYFFTNVYTVDEDAGEKVAMEGKTK